MSENTDLPIDPKGKSAIVYLREYCSFMSYPAVNIQQIKDPNDQGSINAVVVVGNKKYGEGSAAKFSEAAEKAAFNTIAKWLGAKYVESYHQNSTNPNDTPDKIMSNQNISENEMITRKYYFFVNELIILI